jgi:hypothetical protein
MIFRMDESTLIGALQSGWPDEADAVGPAVLRDIVTGEHRLEAVEEGQQFDLSGFHRILEAAVPVVGLALKLIIERYNQTRKEASRRETVDEVLSELKRRRVGASLDDEAKVRVIIYIIEVQKEERYTAAHN